MRFDIHVHTTHSPCSALSVEEILHNARLKNLDGVCITDHDTMAVRNQVREGVQGDGLVVIIGMEYTTASGDFLLFGSFEDLPPGLSAYQLLPAVQAAGGVAVAAHPCRRIRGTDEHLISKGLCSHAEGINGRNHPHENLAVSQWPELYGTRLLGGSDAHDLDELGKVTTLLHRSVKNKGDFINVLKNNAFSLTRDSIDFHRTAMTFSSPAASSLNQAL